MKDKESLTGQNTKKRLDAVSERGSLGLLALGAVGLIAWREKRKEATKDSNEKK